MKSSFLIAILIVSFLPLITPHLLFHLVPNQARCYVDELFADSVMMIKWKNHPKIIIVKIIMKMSMRKYVFYAKELKVELAKWFICLTIYVYVQIVCKKHLIL